MSKSPYLQPENYIDLVRAAVAAKFEGPAQYALLMEPFTRRDADGWIGKQLTVPMSLLAEIPLELTEGEEADLEERLAKSRKKLFAQALILEIQDGETGPTVCKVSRVPLQARRNASKPDAVVRLYWPKYYGEEPSLPLALIAASAAERDALLRGTVTPKKFLAER
jgi:hypothetical protein